MDYQSYGAIRPKGAHFGSMHSVLNSSGILLITLQVIETTRSHHKTKQIPYIVFNGEDYTESSAIINFLSPYFNIDETKGLTVEQQGSARALQKMVEENFGW